VDAPVTAQIRTTDTAVPVWTYTNSNQRLRRATSASRSGLISSLYTASRLPRRRAPLAKIIDVVRNGSGLYLNLEVFNLSNTVCRHEHHESGVSRSETRADVPPGGFRARNYFGGIPRRDQRTPCPGQRPAGILRREWWALAGSNLGGSALRHGVVKHGLKGATSPWSLRI